MAMAAQDEQHLHNMAFGEKAFSCIVIIWINIIPLLSMYLHTEYKASPTA